jgi:hypothetical protein
VRPAACYVVLASVAVMIEAASRIAYKVARWRVFAERGKSSR